MEIDREGLEVLDRRECLRLLGGTGIGRIAVTAGALPVVLPVDYAMDGDSIVIETGRGTTLDFGTTGSVVAFEVDNLHEHGHCGWTVMVTGVAQEVDDGPEVARLRRLLAEGDDEGDERFIRISSELIVGWVGRPGRFGYRQGEAAPPARCLVQVEPAAEQPGQLVVEMEPEAGAALARGGRLAMAAGPLDRRSGLSPLTKTAAAVRWCRERSTTPDIADEAAATRSEEPMNTVSADCHFIAHADPPPRMRCPVCGHRRLWAISTPAFDRFVCPGCRRCWEFEGGLAHRVDSTACPGCPSRAVCTAPAPGPAR